MTKKDLEKKPRGCRAITAWCYFLQLHFKVNDQQSYVVERVMVLSQGLNFKNHAFTLV